MKHRFVPAAEPAEPMTPIHGFRWYAKARVRLVRPDQPDSLIRLPGEWHGIREEWLIDALEKAEILAESFPVQARLELNQAAGLPFECGRSRKRTDSQAVSQVPLQAEPARAGR